MAYNREFKDEDTSLDPEDVNSGPTRLTPEQLAAEDERSSRSVPDPNDVVPVPPAMSAAEIDQRAEVVEELRDEASPIKEPGRDDDDSGVR